MERKSEEMYSFVFSSLLTGFFTKALNMKALNMRAALTMLKSHVPSACSSGRSRLARSSSTRCANSSSLGLGHDPWV